MASSCAIMIICGWSAAFIAARAIARTIRNQIWKDAARTLVNVEYRAYICINIYLSRSRIAVLENSIAISESDIHIRANSYFTLLVFCPSRDASVRLLWAYMKGMLCDASTTLNLLLRCT